MKKTLYTALTCVSLVFVATGCDAEPKKEEVKEEVKQDETKKEETKQTTTQTVARNGEPEEMPEDMKKELEERRKKGTTETKGKQETNVPFKKVSMDQYIKNYNKIKEKMKKEGKEIFPFEYEKQDHLVGYTVYSTKSKTEYQKNGYTKIDVYLNDEREVVHISYAGNVTDMNTIQAMTEASNIKWTKEMENMVLARKRNTDGINMSNGVSFDASIPGNDDEISIEIWTNHNDR